MQSEQNQPPFTTQPINLSEVNTTPPPIQPPKKHHRLLFIVLALLLITGLAGGAWYYFHQNDKNSPRTGNITGDEKFDNYPGASCATNDGLEVCLSISQATFTSADSGNLVISITNKTKQTVNKEFGATCTGPSIKINGTDFAKNEFCGLSITNIAIKPKDKKTYKYGLSGSRFKTGNNIITASWVGSPSGELSVQKTAPSTVELTRQFNECQAVPDQLKQTDLVDVPDFCVRLTVTLKENLRDKYNCEDWKNLIAKSDLKVPCSYFMDLGLTDVIVPRENYQPYLDKLKLLPEAELVHINSSQL